MFIKMKATAKILAITLALIMLLTFASCGDISPENSAPPSATVPPPTSSPSSDPTDPADASTTPPSEPTLLTYDEARAICGAWLDDHADLTSYSIPDYDPYEIPPPTYSLFGTDYYEFCVSYSWDEAYANGHLHYILVHAETGELLSRFIIITEGERRTVTVELLDDWYTGEHAAYPPALLTADEAMAIYDAWRDKHGDYSEYSLNRQSYGQYVIFGEQYYYFHAEDGYMYWYNILVHMETGELLFMMIEDGMFGGEHVMQLDYWHDRR